ncbi:MAG: hypothetical protein H8D34_02150 [Chloroflexi bacterium]|nr:hypothetical protein [Chloroflexota bacterium]
MEETAKHLIIRKIRNIIIGIIVGAIILYGAIYFSAIALAQNAQGNNTLVTIVAYTCIGSVVALYIIYRIMRISNKFAQNRISEEEIRGEELG